MAILAWVILRHGFQHIYIPNNNFPNSNHRSNSHKSHHNSRCNSNNSNRYRIYMVFLLPIRLQGALQIEITLA